MRAVAEIDEDARGGQRIVVTEVPYQTSVEVIGTKIAELVNDRRIEGIRDVRNESAGDTTRLVDRAEARRERAGRAQPALQAHADAVVVRGEHARARRRRAALARPAAGARRVRRAPGRGRHPAQRVPAAQGARSRAHPRGPAQGARHDRRDHHADPRFGVGRRGAHGAAGGAVRVQRDAGDAHPRHAAAPARRARAPEARATSSTSCAATIAELEAILADETKLRGVIKDELTAIRDKYGDDRRTEITTDPGDLADLDLIEDEELVVVLSHKGYVKTVAVDQFRAQGRGGKGVRGGNLRDEDYVEHLLTTHRALVPVVLLEPRPRLPPARARDPDEGPHRARHRAREPRRARSPTSTSKRSSTRAPTKTARTCSSRRATAS